MTRLASFVAICLAAALLSSGCGAGATPDSLRGLPMRHDPALDLGDDDDLGRARAAYDALPLDDAARAPRRRELWAVYQARIAGAGSRTEAFGRFNTALEMWSAVELADASKPAPDLELVAPTAEGMLREYSTAGADLEVATAIAVIVAANPARTAALDKTWADIVAYTDDLAVAEAGPGAERSRAIVVLESVTAHFPSRWAGDKLVALYLARQEVIDKALKAGNKQDVLGAHRDPGVTRPVWNLVRVYARMGRLADSADVVDKLAGEFGDEAELRKRLRAALTGSEGTLWLQLMAAFLPGDRRDDGDTTAAYAICLEGAHRLPNAVEPRKCLAELARISERFPLAIRWAEEARKIAPDDHDIGEVLARVYLVRVGDSLLAERVDAAHAEMKQVEDFYADAAKRWPGKPLDTSMSDAYVIFGRGLYNLGEVDEAIRWLVRAQKLGVSPPATEELATIAMKTGRYADAAKGYAEAAALPRPTPLETSFESARLRRLEGEALAAAGDHAKADALFKQALDDWRDVLGAALNPRGRAQVYTEVARLYDDVGDHDKSLQAFNAAVDSDPDQVGIYGDVISFLATRGRYDAALDTLHRALGRPDVTEYLKVYASLWLYDLARLQGRDADPLLVDYLHLAAKGNRWFHKLARFKLGEMSFDQLLAAADTRGRRAEAYFYLAMSRFVAKDKGGADHLLAEVKATRMLGFFEYDMASYYLAHGPPMSPAPSPASAPAPVP